MMTRSVKASEMSLVVVLSMWSTVVPSKEQCPERFLCLRDTCHVEVPEEVSFHFLKLACVENPPVCYLLGAPVWPQRGHLQQKENGLIHSLISSSQSNVKLTLIANKKEKVLKQSWSLWLRFRAQGNLKAWNVELERIWCASNWTEGDTVSGVCTFKHYLSNVLWHVWGIGGKGIEMRDLCRRHCSFISLLQSECTLCRAKKQADIQVDSDHTEYVFELSGYSL